MRNRHYRVSIAFIAAMSLLSCVLPSSGDQALPTQLPGMLNTIVAGTAGAAQTQTQLFMPTPTQTPIVTETLAVTHTPLAVYQTSTPLGIFPTATQQASAQQPASTGTILPSATFHVLRIFSRTPTKKSGNDEEATRTPYPKEKPEWGCEILERKPAMGTVIRPNANFTMSWKVRNIGTKTWTANGVDFTYKRGYRSGGGRIQDLDALVGPGYYFTFSTEQQAPKKAGTYNAVWSLRVGNTYFCEMKFTFVVEKQ